MRDRCCFKCRHHYVVPHKDCPSHQVWDTGAGGFWKDVIEWDKVPMCRLDPTVTVAMGGDTRMVCDRFELDRTRWHSLREQEWEYRVRVKHAQARGGQTTLEAFR
ncbi:hypothetical protein JS82_05125 [Methanomassiliicoccaceae archaeon DOK]|nr:hypothetical protein JS82_05125 [Methanomassiliicoccaceae archaeon DOK]